MQRTIMTFGTGELEKERKVKSKREKGRMKKGEQIPEE